ncbi:hypothetical protein SAMN05428949_6030 [Chitinophaga sp. YR627]|uniref:hypothetical protein n=1 Tax=Chitinophaga sp. YR627 TaxID=1881041 RepID=UPI0008DEB333|nr:hypothetical protein [Chitinophaga sp. YR627]SFO66304.1 hypothetical protein SAMN05428949_6030 [Chitinophaga sp. YR627]
MKLGSFEGTPEELKDICTNHGFNPEDFLNTAPRYNPKVWALLLLVILFAIVNIFIMCLDPSKILKNSLIIANFIIIIMITSMVHLKFEKTYVTLLVFFGGLIVCSVSLGYMTPKEALKQMQTKLPEVKE